MFSNIFIRFVWLFAGFGMCMVASAAYPERTIKLVVPFPAGGAADIMARGLATKLSSEIGQAVVIDNKGGAGGTTASEVVAKAPADGYTLLFGTMGTHAINPALYQKLRYDSVNDFAPVSLTHITPRVLIVHSSIPVNSVPELILWAKKNPGTLSYGSAGSGSSSHLSGALFASLAGIDLLHIPYKGSAPLVTDILTGRVNMTFDSFTVYAPHIRSGKVKALGVTSHDRMTVLPDVPTIIEGGLKSYEVSNWLGVMAPAGTPDAIIKLLNSALIKSAKSPELRAQLQELGIEVKTSTPAQFSELIRTDMVKWFEIVKKSGAKAD
ncbi:MAG: tripartite tricarboxylate transporter substrate binding protein [Betaproteobacteria bacterium]|nr:tripartite tricarboxylate transporter substrate binding protein [Betaproteobacteria bacterium]